MQGTRYRPLYHPQTSTKHLDIGQHRSDAHVLRILCVTWVSKLKFFSLALGWIISLSWLPQLVGNHPVTSILTLWLRSLVSSTVSSQELSSFKMHELELWWQLSDDRCLKLDRQNKVPFYICMIWFNHILDISLILDEPTNSSCSMSHSFRSSTRAYSPTWVIFLQLSSLMM